MKGNWKTYLRWIALAEGVGALSGFLSRDGVKIFMETVYQPPLSPPGAVFPIVWGILYALMGFGAARVSLAEPSDLRGRGLKLFLVQLAVNFFWSLIFFNLQAFGYALAWLGLLWLLVVAMTLVFHQVDTVAGWAQVPYLLWLTFAGYLNAGVWVLN